MAVRDMLLVILSLGPAYGSQLHTELVRRTGGRRTVNVGQIYSTVERLRRDHLVCNGGQTDDGLELHRLTPTGRAEAERWLFDPYVPASATPQGSSDIPTSRQRPRVERTTTIERVLLALSLPSGVARRTLTAELAAWARVGVAPADGVPSPGGRDEDVSGTVAREDALARIADDADSLERDATLTWLDSVSALIDAEPAFGVIESPAVRPPRGRRPVQSISS